MPVVVCLPKQFAMAFSAISFSVVLSEVASSKGIHAKSANEVLGMPLLIQCIHTSSRDGFPTTSTERASLLMIVYITIRLTTKLIECTTSEVLLAILANKVLWMPLSTQRVDSLTSDRLVTSTTTRNECGVEALLAEWSSVSLKEASSFKGTQALGADEVMYMPLPPNGGNTTVKDRFITMSTS